MKNKFTEKIIAFAKSVFESRNYDQALNFSFKTKKFEELTDDEIRKVKELFDNNYGIYAENSPVRPRERIKFKFSDYKKMQNSGKHYISYCLHNKTHVGHAIYVLHKTKEGYLSWIVQLVVDKAYRNKKIAKKLLWSVWGFSSDRAWGLATPNPKTVKVLESATMRKVTVTAMKNHSELIKQIAKYIDFIDIEKWEISSGLSIIDTKFYVDHRDAIKEKKQIYGKNWGLGELKDGHEWIAFTFQGQDIIANKNELIEKIDHSSNNVEEAYERMNFDEHKWNKFAEAESEYIAKIIKHNYDAKIIDFGCGDGRHVLKLYEKGFHNICGIDLIQSRIENAKKKYKQLEKLIECADCRTFYTKEKADCILCLYDVIGSYFLNEENEKILDNIRMSLKRGGDAIISVLNYEVTEKICKNKIDSVLNNPKKIYNLKPSRMMQSSGNIFDPESMLVETSTHCVYRKEIFVKDGRLSSEYLIIDRRYTEQDLYDLMRKYGFEIIELKRVSAGKWNINQSPRSIKGKEMLIWVKRVI